MNLKYWAHFILKVLGIAMLGIGTWVRVEQEEYEKMSEFDYNTVANIAPAEKEREEYEKTKFDYITVANIALAVGIIMLIVAIFGFFGALVENSRILLAVNVPLYYVFIFRDIYFQEIWKWEMKW